MGREPGPKCFEVGLADMSDRLDVAFYSIRRATEQRLPQRCGRPMDYYASQVRTRTPTREQFRERDGIPCIKLRNVLGGFLNISDCDYVPRRFRASFTLAQKYDLILTATGEGTVGRVAIFIEEGDYIVTGENILLRPHRNRVNPFYLLAMLRTDVISAQLRNYVRGATGQTHLYWHDVKTIVVPEASQQVQKQFESQFRQAWALMREAESRFGELQIEGEDIIERLGSEPPAPRTSTR